LRSSAGLPWCAGRDALALSSLIPRCGLTSACSRRGRRVQPYSLQLDDSFDRRAGLDVQATDLSSELTSWDLTASAMMELDLIISVDTSCAHLAGALGRPLWILTPACPDWRWMLRREDTPWYPGARLFRQPRAGDWGSVLETIASELCVLVG
jgi:hypothetical protein